ncbi:MAG: hypothetical protein AAFP76_04630 [Bacteroidota bacterium]
MKYFLITLFLIIAATLGYGFYIKPVDVKTGDFCIGISMVVLFFLWMPLFIYHRWKNRDVKDYMLTKENLDKMRQEAEDKDM